MTSGATLSTVTSRFPRMTESLAIFSGLCAKKKSALWWWLESVKQHRGRNTLGWNLVITNFLKSASSLKRSSSDSLLLSCLYRAENRALLSKVPEASLNTGLQTHGEIYKFNENLTLAQRSLQTRVHAVVRHLAVQAKGIVYCPNLLQATLAFFSTFWATWSARRRRRRRKRRRRRGKRREEGEAGRKKK